MSKPLDDLHEALNPNNKYVLKDGELKIVLEKEKQ